MKLRWPFGTAAWRPQGDGATRDGLTPSRAGAPAPRAGGDDGPVALAKPKSPAAEAYRVIRTNLEFAAPDAALRLLLFTSATASEGKSTTVANLAVTLAQAGRRVLCLDADLRRPWLHRLFGVPATPGLSTVLVGRGAWSDVVRDIRAVPGLQVLPAGPLPPNPAELVGSQRFRDLLAALRDAYDTVLVDVPPVLGVADAVLAARHVDGVVLVVRAGVTRNEALVGAREALERASARVVGVVLNATRAGMGSYHYYYSYTYARRETAAGADADPAFSAEAAAAGAEPHLRRDRGGPGR